MLILCGPNPRALFQYSDWFFFVNSFRNPAAPLSYDRCIEEIAVRVGFSVRNFSLRESVESLAGGFGGR